MGLFKKAFFSHLDESNTAAAGGVFGDTDSMGHGGALYASDFYAPGDHRTPTGPKKQNKKKKKKESKKNKNGAIEPFMPTQKRILHNNL